MAIGPAQPVTYPGRQGSSAEGGVLPHGHHDPFTQGYIESLAADSHECGSSGRGGAESSVCRDQLVFNAENGLFHRRLYHPTKWI